MTANMRVNEHARASLCESISEPPPPRHRRVDPGQIEGTKVRALSAQHQSRAHQGRPDELRHSQTGLKKPYKPRPQSPCSRPIEPLSITVPTVKKHERR